MTWSAHIPVRPGWTCTACDEPWPCTAKRSRLSTEYAGRPSALRMMMAMRVADAAEDLRDATPDELRRRFLGWLPRQHGYRASRATTG